MIRSSGVGVKVVYARMDSPVGPVWVATTEAGVCAVGLGVGQPGALFTWLTRRIASESPHEDPATLSSALTQLSEYFSGARREFDLPLDLRGTPFQQAVWDAVAHIPYGATATYGEIARQVGHPRATRAVGQANSANPLPLLIPCHRVIGADGSLVGYGAGLEVKATLLRLENALLV